MDGYATHLPVLMTMLTKTTGPVIEFGCGHYSTPLLHHVCKLTQRKLVSLEGDYQWMTGFAKYNSDFHEVRHVTDWNSVPELTQQWSLAFIDHAPALQRKETIRQMQDVVDYFVIHDSETDSVYHYSEIFPLFPHRFDYTEYRPWTTILSKKYDCQI